MLLEKRKKRLTTTRHNRRNMCYFFFYKNRFSSSIALALSRKVRDAFFFPALSVAITPAAVAVLSRGSNGGYSHRKERERVWSVKRKSSFFSDFTFFSKRGTFPQKCIITFKASRTTCNHHHRQLRQLRLRSSTAPPPLLLLLLRSRPRTKETIIIIILQRRRLSKEVTFSRWLLTDRRKVRYSRTNRKIPSI